MASFVTSETSVSSARPGLSLCRRPWQVIVPAVGLCPPGRAGRPRLRTCPADTSAAVWQWRFAVCGGSEARSVCTRSRPRPGGRRGGRPRRRPDDTELGLTRHPFGATAVITPRYFPVTMVLSALGPLLAAGNTTVVTPSERSPVSTVRLSEPADAVGIPPGVTSAAVVSGRGAVQPGLGVAGVADIEEPRRLSRRPSPDRPGTPVSTWHAETSQPTRGRERRLAGSHGATDC
ncbi:aldehyde dehydrogenase family protein [Streptomyces sp. 067-1]|uniref:aldehyde dehydrogenase family protein n=1 Tax=Streptomyces sp. 067-1 TaxID=2789269 RepID=UPI0039F56DD7